MVVRLESIRSNRHAATAIRKCRLGRRSFDDRQPTADKARSVRRYRWRSRGHTSVKETTTAAFVITGKIGAAT